MSRLISKGPEREANVSRDEYYSDEYFSMQQLCSLAHQANQVMKLKPRKVLEIGPGNGFLSAILRQSGVVVTTVDINPNLRPDIVSSINDLPNNLKDNDFSLVICAEVLEHLPFKEFEKSINIFKGFSRNLYLTLPQYRKWFGFSGWIRYPRNNKLFSLGLYLKTKKEMGDSHVHFWEVDQSKDVSRSEIIKVLSSKYNHVEAGVYSLNRYHEYFICSADANS